jgi:hypothetical protein
MKLTTAAAKNTTIRNDVECHARLTEATGHL